MELEIRNEQGERIDFTYHPGAKAENRLVVLGHGVTANKDRAFLVAIADGLCQSGLHVLRLSFAGNGESEGRFEDATITKEVADLGSVLTALASYRIGYIGHSMGGAVGVIRAAEDDRIRVLVSLAGMVHTGDFAQRKFGSLKPGKDVMWDKPECPLSAEFMKDLETIDSVAGRARDISIPWLLLHGSADTVVPIQDSLDIQKASPERPELLTIQDADHVFTRPYDAQMVEQVVPWVLAQTFM